MPWSVRAQISLTDIGASNPTPGAYDISQLSTSGNQRLTGAFNYYTDTGRPKGIDQRFGGGQLVNRLGNESMQQPHSFMRWPTITALLVTREKLADRQKRYNLDKLLILDSQRADLLGEHREKLTLQVLPQVVKCRHQVSTKQLHKNSPEFRVLKKAPLIDSFCGKKERADPRPARCVRARGCHLLPLAKQCQRTETQAQQRQRRRLGDGVDLAHVK